MSDSIDIKSLSPESLAKLLSAAYRRDITVDQITAIATAGQLLSDSGTINLFEFTAWLLKGNKNDS